MSINSELVHVIFDSLYNRADKWTRELDYATSAACSLTQHSWYPPAQRLLFRHIPKGVRPIRLFDDIRILDIILTPESIPDLAFLLTNCPRLYELIPTWIVANSVGSLRILELMDLSSADMKDVLRLHGPYIYSLRLFCFSYTAASILRSCVNLKEFVLSSLPSVKDLSFVNLLIYRAL